MEHHLPAPTATWCFSKNILNTWKHTHISYASRDSLGKSWKVNHLWSTEQFNVSPLPLTNSLPKTSPRISSGGSVSNSSSSWHGIMMFEGHELRKIEELSSWRSFCRKNKWRKSASTKPHLKTLNLGVLIRRIEAPFNWCASIAAACLYGIRMYTDSHASFFGVFLLGIMTPKYSIAQRVSTLGIWSPGSGPQTHPATSLEAGKLRKRMIL